MTLEPLIVNGVEKGKKGTYQGSEVIIFNHGLNARLSDYTNSFTMSILKSNQPKWTSNWANMQFKSVESAVTFAKNYIREHLCS